LLIMTSC